MKKKHRVLSLLLAFAMMLTFMPAMAFGLEEEPEPSKVITVKVTPYNANDKCEIDPAEGYDVVIESDGFTVAENDTITITPSLLVRNGDQSSSKFTFNYSAVGESPSAWNGGGIILHYGSRTGTHPFTTLDEGEALGYRGNHGLTASEIRDGVDEKGVLTSRSLELYGPAGNEYSEFRKMVRLVIDYGNTEFFKNANDFRDADNLVMFGKDGEILRCDETGPSASNSNRNKETWQLDKAAPFAKQIEDAVDKAEKAKMAAEESAAVAEAAVNKPGDEAVAAAQKAVDDNLAAQAAVEELESLMTSLNESGDIKYVENAVTHSGKSGVTDEQKETAKSFGDAKDSANTIKATYPAELKEAMKESKAILTQAKSENAEKKASEDAKKASEDAKKASDDKAAAEKSAAAAAAYRYTPKRSKVTKVKPAKKSAVVSFKRVYGSINGYQIQVKDKKTGKTKIVKVKKSSKKVISKKIKGLKKNRKYSVKVRAYHTVKGKTYYAAWSEAKGFKTKK